MPLVIEIKVVPSSGRVAWKLQENNRLVCYLKSPAQRDKANRELCVLISKALRVPTSACIILSGVTGRLKRLRIETNQSFGTLLKVLNIEQQLKLF